MRAVDAPGTPTTGSVSPAAGRVDLPRSFRVVANEPETADVVTLRVVPVEGELPSFDPAQFTMIGVAGVGEVPISISSAADDRTAHAYTLRRAGAVTHALADRRVGDVVVVRGPFGNTWDFGAGPAHHVFVAGGIGLAPLRAAIHAAAGSEGSAVTVLAGAVEPEHQIFRRWLAELPDSGVTVGRSADRVPDGVAWDGHVGFVTDLVVEAVAAGPGDLPLRAYVCGPDPMMVAAAGQLAAAGLDAADVQFTLERNMQCATGWCGHCQLGPVLVCRDGPVFAADRVRHLLERSEL